MITLVEGVSQEVAFRKAQEKALRDWERFVFSRNQRLTGLMRETRGDILEVLASQTEWSQQHYQRLANDIRSAVEGRFGAISAASGDAAARAAAFARAAVDGPLQALGLAVGARTVGFIPEEELAVLAQYQFELIKGATEDMTRKIQTATLQSLMGGKPKQDLVKQIGSVVGPLKPAPPGSIFGAAEKRAHTIVRTELNRLHNTVTENRIDGLAEDYPGLGKKWIHRRSNYPRESHARLHGKVIYPAKGEFFELAGEKIKGPHDPKLPAAETINCHCMVVAVYDESQDTGEPRDETLPLLQPPRKPIKAMKTPQAPPAKGPRKRAKRKRRSK